MHHCLRGMEAPIHDSPDFKPDWRRWLTVLKCMAFCFSAGYPGARLQRRQPGSGSKSRPTADCCEAVFFRKDRFDLVTTSTFYLDDLITQVYLPEAPSILVFLGTHSTCSLSACFVQTARLIGSLSNCDHVLHYIRDALDWLPNL